MMPRWLTGDRNSIMQMTTNLIGNALKFTRNGRVEINISRDGITRTAGKCGMR